MIIKAAYSHASEIALIHLKELKTGFLSTLGIPFLTALYKRIIDSGMLLVYIHEKKVKKPDVIIVSSLSFLTLLTGVYLKHIINTKLVIEIRDIWPLTLIEIGGWSKNNPIIKFLSFIEKTAYKQADNIIGTMPNLQEHVDDVLGFFKKVEWISMGVSLEHYHQMAGRNVSLPSELNDKFIVCYAGTVGKVNFVHEVLEAARCLQYKYQKIHFLILGNGSELSFLKKKYCDLYNVTFYGEVPKVDLYGYLNRCSLLIHPVKDSPIYKYGISTNKWIDYMLSAKPIISMYNGFQSDIDKAACCDFIPSHDIDSLVESITRYYKMKPKQFAQMGMPGRKLVLTELTYEKLSDKYLGILNIDLDS